MAMTEMLPLTEPSVGNNIAYGNITLTASTTVSVNLAFTPKTVSVISMTHPNSYYYDYLYFADTDNNVRKVASRRNDGASYGVSDSAANSGIEIRSGGFDITAIDTAQGYYVAVG